MGFPYSNYGYLGQISFCCAGLITSYLPYQSPYCPVCILCPLFVTESLHKVEDAWAEWKVLLLWMCCPPRCSWQWGRPATCSGMIHPTTNNLTSTNRPSFTLRPYLIHIFIPDLVDRCFIVGSTQDPYFTGTLQTGVSKSIPATRASYIISPCL